jgi:hypothetical protein
VKLLRGRNISRNRLHLAGTRLITTANRFLRPGSADFVIRKRIEAFDEAIRQQCARLGGQREHPLGQLLHWDGHGQRVRPSDHAGNWSFTGAVGGSLARFRKWFVEHDAEAWDYGHINRQSLLRTHRPSMHSQRTHSMHSSGHGTSPATQASPGMMLIQASVPVSVSCASS